MVFNRKTAQSQHDYDQNPGPLADGRFFFSVGIEYVKIRIVVIDLAVAGDCFVVEIVHVLLYSTSEYAHGDFLICNTEHIVALSANGFLTGSASTSTC